MFNTLNHLACQILNTGEIVITSLSNTYQNLALTADNYGDIYLLKVLDLVKENKSKADLLSIQSFELKEFKWN